VLANVPPAQVVILLASQTFYGRKNDDVNGWLFKVERTAAIQESTTILNY